MIFYPIRTNSKTFDPNLPHSPEFWLGMALIRARSRSAAPEFQNRRCQITAKSRPNLANLAFSKLDHAIRHGFLPDLNSGLGHYVEFGLFDKVSEWVDLECVLTTGSRLRDKQ